MYQKCIKCFKDKPLEDYHKDKKNKNGKSKRCKSCAILAAKLYVEKNTERVAKQRKEHYNSIKDTLEYKTKSQIYNSKRGKDKEKIRMQVWAETNRQRSREIKKKWRDANKGYTRYSCATRKLKLQKARIKSLSKEDKQDIQTYYIVAAKMSNSSIEYQVDHIVPINSKIVCGLHVPWNLRILSAKKNYEKRNILVPELSIDFSAEYYRKGLHETDNSDLGW